MKILILHDEITPTSRPDEADALVQAQAVEAALTELGHRSSTRPVTANLADLMAALNANPPDLVFNLVESLNGHGRLIYLVPAVLDALGVAYTGVRTDAMYLTSNKVMTKAWLYAHGLDTPAWHAPDGPATHPLPLPCRCIVKSVWEDASVGLDDASVIDAASQEEIDAAVALRAERLGGEAFAEVYVEGRELNLSVLADGDGARVLPPAEIEFIDFPAGKPRIVGYDAKWDIDSVAYRNTPRRFGFSAADDAMIARVSGLAEDCWRLFGLRGYARVDFRIDEAGKPYILEVNANPCLSPDAGFAAAAAEAGLTLTDVVERVVADALRTPGAGRRHEP